MKSKKQIYIISALAFLCLAVALGIGFKISQAKGHGTLGDISALELKADVNEEVLSKAQKDIMADPSLPADVKDLVLRVESCNHFEKEIENIPEGADDLGKELQNSLANNIEMLECEEVEPDQQVLLKKYQDNPELLKRLSALSFE